MAFISRSFYLILIAAVFLLISNYFILKYSKNYLFSNYGNYNQLVPVPIYNQKKPMIVIPFSKIQGILRYESVNSTNKHDFKALFKVLQLSDAYLIDQEILNSLSKKNSSIIVNVPEKLALMNKNGTLISFGILARNVLGIQKVKLRYLKVLRTLILLISFV